MANTRHTAAELAAATEPLIVGLAILGDEVAFSELVRRRQGLVRNFLRQLCADSSVADDLSQQVFLQAWRSIARLQSVQAYPAWLKKLSVNAWLQHLRKRERDLNWAQPCDWDEPVATVEQPDQSMDLDAALKLLPPPVRLCLVLSHREGMSHAQIAVAAELPLGTVKSHIQRGGQRLRLLLAAYGSY